MREIWRNKTARKLLVADLSCAIPLGFFVGGPLWVRAIAVVYGALLMGAAFGTGYFSGTSFAYRKMTNEMKEMRETVSEIMAEHQKHIARSNQALVPPPRHYH